MFILSNSSICKFQLFLKWIFFKYESFFKNLFSVLVYYIFVSPNLVFFLVHYFFWFIGIFSLLFFSCSVEFLVHYYFGSTEFFVNYYFRFTQIFGSLLFSVHSNFWFTIIFGSPKFLVHYYFRFTQIFVHYYFRFTDIFGSPIFFGSNSIAIKLKASNVFLHYPFFISFYQVKNVIQTLILKVQIENLK